jgi:hypothetical protein
MTETVGIEDEPKETMPLAWIEPRSHLLRLPEPGQLLYKIIKISYLVDMLRRNYLHFQRADTYTDDKADGEQLPLDRPIGAGLSFERDPGYTLESYYDCARSRTYACCFSLEHSAYIWEHYAPERDAVCLVFDFEKLRKRLNATMQVSLNHHGLLVHGGDRFRQIFSIDYGVVQYVSKIGHSLHPVRIANPIQYTFLKDDRYASEKEFRVALSAPAIGQFVMNDGRMEFPRGLQLYFDYREAFLGRAIIEICCPPSFVDGQHLKALRTAMTELHMRAMPAH